MKNIENKLYKEGYKLIAGLDEAGRGCLAGPLVVAAVVFDKDYVNEEINDSKTIPAVKRHELFKTIKEQAISVEYVILDSEYVTIHNPKQSSINGMRMCLEKLKEKFDYAICDGEDIKLENSLKVIKGDKLSQTIAAASIVAKTIRDQEIDKLDMVYPEFDFKNNQGYGTKKHLDMLKKYGVTKNHRAKYKPVTEQIMNNNFYVNKK